MIRSIGLALCVLSGQAIALDADGRTPIEAYRGDTYFALTTCQIKFKIAQLRAGGGDAGPADGADDYRGCIAHQRSAALTAYQAATRTLKKPKAREALKAYHTIFVSSLQGIEPGADERKISYAQRQVAAKTRIDEAWTAFELEQ